MIQPIVRLVSRGWTRTAFVVVALLSLLQPLLTPFVPEIAGWTPDHGHIYANGEAIPHTHPWDQGPPVAALANTQQPRIVFHLCAIHPDGRVPVGATLPPIEERTGTGPQAAHSASGSVSAKDVAFVFSQNLTGSMLPAPDAAPLACTGAWVAVASAVLPAHTAPFAAPSIPPPRA